MTPTAESQKAADAAYRLAQTHIDSGAMKLVAVVYDPDVLYRLLQHTGCRATCVVELKTPTRGNVVETAPPDTTPRPLKPSFYEVYDFVDEQHPDRAQLRASVLDSCEAVQAVATPSNTARACSNAFTRDYPIYQPGVNDALFLTQFAYEVGVDGLTFLTAPLRCGEVDLLGLSFNPANQRHTLCDSLKPVVRLTSVVICDKDSESTYEVSMSALPQLKRALQGNHRDLTLKYFGTPGQRNRSRRNGEY